MWELINAIWRDVIREPIMAILMAVVVPYVVAVANRHLKRIGLENNALIRDAIHKAAENGVNMAIASGEKGAGNVTASAVEYVKRMNAGGLKKLKIPDNALIDIVRSKQKPGN